MGGSARDRALGGGGLAVFTILFGTRTLDANEQHHGVVMAIALEAVVKLAALLAVGGLRGLGLAGGAGEMLARIDAAEIAHRHWGGRPLGGADLPVGGGLPVPAADVPGDGRRERRRAPPRHGAWAFPLYLFADQPLRGADRGGRADCCRGTNPDLFVLTLPLAFGREDLALLSFLGGLSARRPRW
jgi:hypothetical protein